MNLNAVFSLAVSPPGFNFFYFLVLADAMREREGYTGLDLHILPGPGEGFRTADTEYDPENKRWRLANIVIPGARLLPSLASLTVHDTPKAIEGPTWPGPHGEPRISGYSLVFSAIEAGMDLKRLRPSAQALAYVDEWASASKRRLVVISLRESTYDTWRNSKVQAWVEFARSLDPMIYFPVIVRDTEAGLSNSLDKNIPELPWASFNLDMRAALYERAWVNVGINHGCFEILHFLKHSRYLECWLTRMQYRPDAGPLTAPGRRVVVSADASGPLIMDSFVKIAAEIEAMEATSQESAA